MAVPQKIEWPTGQKVRRLWRNGEDQYEVIAGNILLGVKVGIMRYGFIGQQCYYEVKAIRGNKYGIVHSSFVKNITNPIVPIVPSLVGFAASTSGDPPSASVVRLNNVARPLPLASNNVAPPPPSASVENGVAQRTQRSGSGSGSVGPPTSKKQPDSGAAGAAGVPLTISKIRVTPAAVNFSAAEVPKHVQPLKQIPIPKARFPAVVFQASETIPTPKPKVVVKPLAAIVSRQHRPSKKIPSPSQGRTGPPSGSSNLLNSPSSNSLPSAVRISSPVGTNNAANRTAAAVSGRSASLRSGNIILNPSQVLYAARPAPRRAVVSQIGKKPAKPARAGVKKTTELKTARAKKKKVSQRNSVNRARKCEHNRRATRCPDCVRTSGDGFRSLCPHLKQKGWCTQCKSDDNNKVYYGEARR